MTNSGVNHAGTRFLSDEETRNLIELSRGGDQGAKEKLLQCHLRLVRSIVSRFGGRGVEFDDLFQIGSLGLLKAVERFDPARGVKFSTYAVPVIMGEIKQYLREDGMIRTGRGMKNLAGQVYQARQRFLDRFGREPTISDLEHETKLTREEIAAALEMAKPVSSLQEVVHEDDGVALTLADRIGEESEEEWVEEFSLREALGRLEPRLKLIVEERFFHERTQEEIAARIGVSQVHVSRLEKVALNSLREMLRDEV